MIYSHFAIQSMKEFLGDHWELFECARDISPDKKIGISAKIKVNQFTIEDVAKGFQQLFLNSPLVIKEIDKLKGEKYAAEGINKTLKEEIKRLSVFESYYNLHFKMTHGKVNEKTT